MVIYDHEYSTKKIPNYAKSNQGKILEPQHIHILVTEEAFFLSLILWFVMIHLDWQT